MTLKELIDSLRCCSDMTATCADCFFAAGDSGCHDELLAEAAKRLEQMAVENERLKHKATNSCDDWVDD
jgi:hypothetical protein